jgi:hypothetical protein
MNKRRNFEKFNKFMNDTFPRASLAEKAIAECVWDRLQNEIDALKCLNRNYSKIIDEQDASISAAPTPPEVEPVAWMYTSSKGTDLLRHRMSDLEKQLCPDDMREIPLFTCPPSPKADWDAEGNPMNLQAAADKVVESFDKAGEVKIPYGLLRDIEALRKFRDKSK